MVDFDNVLIPKKIKLVGKKKQDFTHFLLTAMSMDTGGLRMEENISTQREYEGSHSDHTSKHNVSSKCPEDSNLSQNGDIDI